MAENIHPFNMLSASEISDAVSILKQSNKDHENSSFSYISLEEPEKKLLKENTNLAASFAAFSAGEREREEEERNCGNRVSASGVCEYAASASHKRRGLKANESA